MRILRLKLMNKGQKVWKWKSLSHVWLCNPMDYTVHGILQARILEWVAIPFSRDLTNPGIEPRSPALQVDSLSAEPQGKPESQNLLIFRRSACFLLWVRNIYLFIYFGLEPDLTLYTDLTAPDRLNTIVRYALR